jgi:uncharacterized membrane protein
MLCYLIGPFTVIFFLVMERDNKNVKFHAMQSTIYFGALLVLEIVLGLLSGLWVIGAVFALANWVLGLVWLVSVVYLMFTAYQGKHFRIPYIGDSVWHNINK